MNTLNNIKQQQQRNARAIAKLDREINKINNAMIGKYESAHNVRGACFVGFTLSTVLIPLLCFIL